MIEIKNCKICGSKNLFTLKKYEISPALSADWDYVLKNIAGKDKLSARLCMCGKCGFVFYKDVFSQDELKKLYGQEKRFESLGRTQEKNGRKEELRRTLDFFEKHVPFEKISDVMDVGSGDFVFLDKLMEKFPEVKYQAMDPSFSEDFYKNVEVIHDLIEDYEVKVSHDLILLVHVLEHISDLDLFMSKINLMVNDGEYAYIEVPFQVGPGLFFNRAVNSQHINYFTPSSISNILNKHGFKIEKIDFDKAGYKYNGMPGMIRILAKKEGSGKKLINAVWENLYFLFSPLLFIKSRLF